MTELEQRTKTLVEVLRAVPGNFYPYKLTTSEATKLLVAFARKERQAVWTELLQRYDHAYYRRIPESMETLDWCNDQARKERGA